MRVLVLWSLLLVFAFASSVASDECVVTQADYDPGQYGRLMKVWMTSSGWGDPWEVAPPFADSRNPGIENYGLYQLPNVIPHASNWVCRYSYV